MQSLRASELQSCRAAEGRTEEPLDYHGSKDVPTGTCQAVLKAAGVLGEMTND
jgi:hypothetical protein